jgi:predicted glutamine amidotransferase
MCELFGMSGKWPATVNFSLMKFAEHGGHTGPHQDGWGIGYYAGRDVRLIKEAEAAADSEWVRFMMDHAIKTPLAIAHVRLHRQCRNQEDAFAARGLSIDAMEQDIMLFASVPLTDEAWEPLTEGEIIVVSEGCIVTPHSR